MRRTLPTGWAAAAWALVAALVVWVVWQSAAPPRQWVVTQWLLSWEFGFVKRGLPGEVVRRLEPFRDHLTIAVAATAATVAASLALIGRVLVSLRGAFRDPGAPLFAAFFLAHFAVLPNMAADAGRFDHIGVLALVLVLGLVSRASSRGWSPGPWLIPIFVLGLLTHEAWLFLFIPSMVAAWWFASVDEGRENRRLDPWIPAAAGVVLVTLGIVTRFGGMRSMTLTEHYERLSAGIDAPVDRSSVRVLHDALAESSANTRNYILNLETLLDHLLLLVTFAPTVALLFLMLRAAGAVDASGWALRRRVIAAAPLTPLALYPIGLDYVRWCSLVVVLSLTLLAWRMRVPAVREAVLGVVARYWWLVGLTLLVTLVMGEAGVYFAFPARMQEIWAASDRAFR